MAQMQRNGFCVGKRYGRRILAAALAFCLFPVLCATAGAAVELLTSPAIPVLHPAEALLVAVTRAGDRLVAVGAHGLTIYSDDNGRSWRQGASPTSETLTCVAFADPAHGWAAGGQGIVLRSTDGGANWRAALNGEDVIRLMNIQAVQYAAERPGDPLGVRAVRRAGIFAAAGNSKPFLSVLPLGAASAIIFGAYRMTVLTTDGGKSWTDWSLHVGDPISHNIYAAVRVQSAVYLAGEAGSIFRSMDNGQNFSMLTAPDDASIFGILGTPKNALLTYGVSGEVFRSVDQGQTWIAATISADSDITSAILLRSGQILLASEAGGIFESKDDGQTFQSVPMNLGMAPFDMTQAANGDIVFVGSGGVRAESASSLD